MSSKKSRDKVLDAIQYWCRQSRRKTDRATRVRRRVMDLFREADTVILDLDGTATFLACHVTRQRAVNIKLALTHHGGLLTATLIEITETTQKYRRTGKWFTRRDYVPALKPLVEVSLDRPDSLAVLAKAVSPFITLDFEGHERARRVEGV